MLEQSQQDFTISYFCRLILLHNLNDWQSAIEEQKMSWTREGIFLSHVTLLLFPAQIFSIRAPQKQGRRQRWSITVSAKQSLCVQMLSDWWHCPFYFPEGLECVQVPLIYQMYLFSNCNRLCFLFKQITLIFFSFSSFISRWKLYGKKSFSNRETSSLWDEFREFFCLGRRDPGSTHYLSCITPLFS